VIYRTRFIFILLKVSSLDDVKSTSQTDNNAAKTISLDHLGVIAARIRSSMLKVQQAGSESNSKFKALKPLDEVWTDLCKFD
jgi:cohesin loading factor subunit SCC2